MSPKLFKKEGIEGEIKPKAKPEIPQPETEGLPDQEKEHLRAEILKEIENQQEKKQPLESAPPTKQPPAPLPTTKSQTLVNIEHVLEEDLKDFYFKLKPEEQKKFRAKGEETAREIEKILLDTKQKVENKMKSILDLIINWLKIIPGVNKFFIRQEAKIKAEKIMKIDQ